MTRVLHSYFALNKYLINTFALHSYFALNKYLINTFAYFCTSYI